MSLQKQHELGNGFERAVLGRDDVVPPRETARYEWAKANVYGSKILEIGCTSGYGVGFFKDIPNLTYLGVDKDEAVLKYATEQFGDVKGVKFFQADINAFDITDKFDTIIAMEILEHIPNGREIAQELKKHCHRLICTVPYNEAPGFWGGHHVLHKLNQLDFPGFKHQFLQDDCVIADEPDDRPTNLMLMIWDEEWDMPIEVPKYRKLSRSVTVEICTKDRYFTTLPLAITSVINQTVKPQKLVIYDDSKNKLDLREQPTYKMLFALLEQNNIQWAIEWTPGKGQTPNHQRALMESTTNYVWRIDDDNIAEPDVLENLLNEIESDDKIGACGCLVWHPDGAVVNKPSFAKGSITPGLEFMCVEWFKQPTDELIDVEHLYSTFLYKRHAGIEAGGYPMDLSPVGHHEETTFTYRIKRAGYRLVVSPKSKLWHLRNPEGGIRAYESEFLWKHDTMIFEQRAKEEWGLTWKPEKIIVLDNGLGDHLMFKNVLPEIQAKYPEHRIIIACAHPEVFEDEDVTIISIFDAQAQYGDLSQWNLYKWCDDRNWKKHLIDAYREMYL